MTSEEIRNLKIDGVDVPFYDGLENVYISGEYAGINLP